MQKTSFLLGIALVVILTSCGLSTGHTMDATIDTSDWQTHCFGRYLIDLPPGAHFSATYKYGGDDMKTMAGITAEYFENKIGRREAELKKTTNDKGGNQFIKITRFDANDVLITSWSSPYSQLLHRQQLYLFRSSEKQKFLYVTNGETGIKKPDATRTYYRKVASLFHYRPQSKIPTGPGFCINHGLIASNQPNHEEVQVSIGFEQYEAVTASMLIFPTENPPKPLLERMGGLPTSLARALAGTDTLRKGDRNLGPQKGQEYAARADEDGKTSYQFVWDSLPVADSMSRQSINIELSTADRRPHGEVIDAPFKNNAEALGFWDAILDSFRLRPGAT